MFLVFPHMAEILLTLLLQLVTKLPAGISLVLTVGFGKLLNHCASDSQLTGGGIEFSVLRTVVLFFSIFTKIVQFKDKKID